MRMSPRTELADVPQWRESYSRCRLPAVIRCHPPPQGGRHIAETKPTPTRKTPRAQREPPSRLTCGRQKFRALRRASGIERPGTSGGSLNRKIQRSMPGGQIRADKFQPVFRRCYNRSRLTVYQDGARRSIRHQEASANRRERAWAAGGRGGWDWRRSQDRGPLGKLRLLADRLARRPEAEPSISLSHSRLALCGRWSANPR